MSLYEFTIGRGQFEEINNYLLENLGYCLFGRAETKEPRRGVGRSFLVEKLLPCFFTAWERMTRALVKNGYLRGCLLGMAK